MASMAASEGSVRLLQEQDITVAAELSAEAGWNQTRDDWRMLLRMNPESCFGIDAGGRLVSTATLVCYGLKLGWIGMVLTNLNYRRRGFARTLLRHAIKHADEFGIECLKLDATDQGQPIYESLGFRVEQPVERWWRAAVDRTGNFQPSLYSFAGDLAAYGVDRSQLLQNLMERGTICARGDGVCLSRPGRVANYIGPCVSRSAQLARQLIESCASAASYWDLLPQNQTALALATELGFTPQRKLIRMVRGKDLRGREDWLYAIAGFELG